VVRSLSFPYSFYLSGFGQECFGFRRRDLDKTKKGLGQSALVLNTKMNRHRLTCSRRPWAIGIQVQKGRADGSSVLLSRGGGTSGILRIGCVLSVLRLLVGSRFVAVLVFGSSGVLSGSGTSSALADIGEPGEERFLLILGFWFGGFPRSRLGGFLGAWLGLIFRLGKGGGFCGILLLWVD